MKKTIPIIFAIVSIIFFVGCEKTPVANFTTDKDSYYTGETVHLRDASTNAKSWTWTTPDGSLYSSQNLDYVIDPNDIGGNKIFILDVTDGSGSSTMSKSIIVYQAILPSDYFSVRSTVYKPTVKGGHVRNGNWLMSASNGAGPLATSYFMDIYFPGTIAPTSSGTYSLQSDYNNLMPDQACVNIYLGHGYDAWENILSLSGQLFITLTNDGKVRAIFNNVNAQDAMIGGTSTVTISGDITCR